MCNLRWQYKATKAQLKSKIEVNGTNTYSIAVYGSACFLNPRPLFRSIRASRLSKFLHHKLWKARLSRFVAWNLVFTTAGLEAVLKTWHDNAHSPVDLLCIRKVYLKASLIANENDKIPQRRQGTELFPWSSVLRTSAQATDQNYMKLFSQTCPKTLAALQWKYDIHHTQTVACAVGM